MIINESSAEFELNSNIGHILFGLPKYMESGKPLTVAAGYDAYSEKFKPITIKEIGKLKMWENYRSDISRLYDSSSTKIAEDVNGVPWIYIGGSGWGRFWSVGY